MEIIEKYRSESYNNHFVCDYLWVNCEKNRNEFFAVINQLQAGDRTTSTITISDVDHILKRLKEYPFDDELITKLVVQKANFDVKPQTLANGCTTRLFFFLRNGKDWFLYGHAKGRYVNWELFNIKKGEKLGYSIYLSINEQDKDISAGLPDNYAVSRIIERLRQSAKNQQKADK